VEIKQYNNLPTHTFKHFGSKLLWKAIFSAPEDPMAEYTGASFDTPWISEIEFEYTHVERREYSRTSVAATVTTEEALKKRLIIGSTFYYPGWRGHLRAYDVSTMTPQDTTYSVLRTVTRPNADEPFGREIVQEGVEILWDAGLLLYDRDASTRNVYTAVPSGGDLDRVEFTAANVGVLGPILQDVNNDNEGLINFIRGEGREWKLGDSNHSNPIVVGPPFEAPQKMGDGYQDFINAWEDRRKVLYIGANDGMIHCFDVLTGEELWGFIPYNLLPRMRDMWEVFPSTGQRYYEHHIYVDGSPVAADVFIDADGDNKDEWRTILICGQGPGHGSALAGGLNYYFALDVTNPEDPQPLWEFTHPQMGETWSVPAVGKVSVLAQDTWVAFMGSGYDNNGAEVAGNRFYVIDLSTGEEEWGFDVDEVDTTAALGWNIPNTLPGSPAGVDVDQNGLADSVYIADLDGRIWKVDVSPNLVNTTSWAGEVIYEDSNNFPIVCKPAVWVNPISVDIVPRLFFGTGGDDRAPGDVNYSFIALIDGAVPEVEWYLGDPLVVGLPAEDDMGDLAIGDKVWADPQIADFICYFSTLVGSIDSVDPCESLAGVGKLYARFIQAEAGTNIGSTALQTFTGPVESLELSIKTRAAVTLGERQRTGDGTRKREVYIQEYDSTIQKLEQFAMALLKVRSWREIYKVIR
jgi:outer membrane protein assembly factor BamB